MKLYIQIFKDNNFGNCRFDIIIVPNNKILVSDLKQILYEKYGVSSSNQRLTVKIGNKQFVIMTNDYPLNFFFIKEKSIIYVEFIQTQSKTDENSNKTHKNKRDVKSKYLKSLGILQKFPPMETIKESTIEDLEEDSKSPGTNSKNIINNKNKIDNNEKNNSEEFKIKIKDKLTKAIIKNKLEEFREILDNKYEFININKPIDNFQKFSAIHYVALYGYQEMLQDLLNKYEANVNLVSLDNWSALHLSTYKGHINIVNILIQFKDTNCDLCLPKIGTALHLACKRNNFKIVSLLLHKCNPRIRNDSNKLPIEIANDHNIKKLLNKIMYSGNGNKKYDEEDLKVKFDNNILNIKKNNYHSKYIFLNSLSYIPEQLPRYCGYIYKKGNVLSHYNLRFVEVDPYKGLFFRYENLNDYPIKPKEVSLLKEMKNCIRINENSPNYFYIEINFNNNSSLYRFESKETCDKWLDVINKCANYTKFWNNLSKKYHEVYSYLASLNKSLSEINYNSGEIKLLVSKNSIEKKIKEGKDNNNNIQKQRRKNPYALEDSKLLEDPILNNNEVCFNSFEILDCLGSGSFGKVFKVKMKKTGKIYAMKVINKKFLMKNNQLRYAITECNVLKQSKSPFILTLYYSFQTPENLYMILDYCPGGDLNFHILQSLFEEDEAKFYIAELILAIEHLHELNIIYRDLKPENILINSDNHIKLADFGLSKEGVNDSQMSKSFCGSPAYLAPEMLSRKGAGKSADIYGIGAVLYEMICGSPPFFSNNIRTLYRNISQSKLMLHDYFSDELKDLLRRLLCKDPHKRIGVLDKNEIKNHVWFKGIDWEKLAKKDVEPPLNLLKIKKKLDDKNEQNVINRNKIRFVDKDYNSKNKETKRIPRFTFVRNLESEKNN